MNERGASGDSGASEPRRDFSQYDSSVLLKRNGVYERVPVNFDINRGKFWLFLDVGDSLCIEAPRLRQIVAKYDRKLEESGLPPVTEDGYGR